MDKFRDCTAEEEAQRSDYAFSFHQWMLGNGVKDNTAKSYTRTLLLIWQDDGKAACEMATQEYFDITKNSMKNKSGNGQRSAAIKKFIDFYGTNKDKIRPAPVGETLYQVKGGPTKNNKPDFLADVDQDSPAARALRINLNLPDDWKCCVRKRSSGDLVCAVSPGGTAYTTKSAVDDRLSRAPGSSTPAPVVAPPAVTPAPTAAASSEPATKKAKSASKATAAAEKPASSKPVEAATQDSVKPAAEPVPAELAGGEELERQEVDLETAFKLLAAAAGNSGGTRPRALVLSGRDPEARLTARIHGLYTEDGVSGKRPLWVKADRERQTCVCFSDSRNNWRIAAGVSEKGDFAKVKDDADLPWKVQKPWTVFNPSEKRYEEDLSLKTTYISVDGPLPSMTVEVCLPKLRTVDHRVDAPSEAPPVPQAQPAQEPPAKKQKTSTKAAVAEKTTPKTGPAENPASKSTAAEKPSPKLAPIAKPLLPPAAAAEPSQRGASSSSSSSEAKLMSVEMALKKLGLDTAGSQELLLITGLDDTAVNVNRIRGVYKKQEQDHGGCPVFQKADLSKGKIALVFFDDAKSKWRIAKSPEDKNDFAHVKAKAKLPWEIEKPWKVYDGNSHAEAPSLMLRRLDPASPPQGVLVQLAGESASTEVEEEPQKREKRVGRGRKVGECYRNNSGVESKKAPDDLPLEMLMALPEDAAPDHVAHVAVKWDALHTRAHFKYGGQLIQTTLRAAGSQHSAEVIARACFVRLKDKGQSKEEVLAFRQKCYDAVSCYVPEEYKKPKNFRPRVVALPAGKSDAAVAESAVASADASAEEADADKCSDSSSSSSSSSVSDAEQAEETDKSASKSNGADSAAPKASRAVGPGSWEPGKVPGRMGRYASMSAVRTGLRCAQCFGGLESKCICK
eukprot:TRINITY_DN19735_c0_g1_i2.p1 TRINITY_DN19735_c0_g1~~TRINITY_DN19735_c0_g1_i2.p1  ORF type:complete len:905 (+),score=204.91 TRINITY_DN19735_c0_g1_i2:157-2871(+)